MPTLKLPSWKAVKLAVAGGAGIAAISRFALGLEIEAGALAVLDVPRWRLSRSISLVRAREVPLSPPAERFLGRLRQRFLPDDLLPPNSNLPAPASPIVGRKSEVDEICAWLRGRAHIVSLTGVGGTGKTRLACEVASLMVDDFRDGVYLVDLAPLQSADDVLPAIRRTLGIPERIALEVALRGRRVLLLLDNFEHIRKAASEVSALATAVPELKVLVTSRAPLHTDGERVHPVEPLPLHDAVTLFIERALAVDPAFMLDEHVTTICQRLEGLPLAVELAAARVKALPPALLLRHLDPAIALLMGGSHDLPPRQRTLATTVYIGTVEMAPGSSFARWHTHPGPVWVVIASGELTLYGPDGCATTYAEGSAYLAQPDTIYDLRNETDQPLGFQFAGVIPGR